MGSGMLELGRMWVLWLRVFGFVEVCVVGFGWQLRRLWVMQTLFKV